MVADKKAWGGGPREAGKQCALAAEVKFARLPATEPYLPPACEGIYIRGLTTGDFHLLVDGKEQRIQSVTSVSAGIRVRDSLGQHNEYSHTPAGRWSTGDSPMPHRIVAGGQDFGLLARNRYDISFVPQVPASVGCHKVKIKVDRRPTIVASEKKYCARESPSDILNGSKFGKELERDLSSGQPGKIPLALQTGVFESEKGKGRVQIALQFPTKLLDREWGKNYQLYATIGVLGVVYRPDGTLVSRFSDFACCKPYLSGEIFGTGFIISDNGSMHGFEAKYISKAEAVVDKGALPARYDTQLDLPSGEYKLQIVLSDGRKFGRAEAHLKVAKPDGNELGLSSVMLCNRFRDAHVAEAETKAANFAPQYVPLVSKGVEVTPAGNTAFLPADPMIAYFEIYVPRQAAGSKPGILAFLKIINAKSRRLVGDFPAVNAATYEQPGSNVIRIARKIPIADLPKGQYKLEVQAVAAAGGQTRWHAADFSVK